MDAARRLDPPLCLAHRRHSDGAEALLQEGLICVAGTRLENTFLVCPKPKQFVLGGRGALGLIPDASWGGGKATAQRKM